MIHSHGARFGGNRRNLHLGAVHSLAFFIIVACYFTLTFTSAWMLWNAYQGSLHDLKSDGLSNVVMASSRIDFNMLDSMSSFDDAGTIAVRKQITALETSQAFAIGKTMNSHVFLLRRFESQWRILSSRESEFNQQYDATIFLSEHDGKSPQVYGPERANHSLWLTSVAPVVDVDNQVVGLLVMNRNLDSWQKGWLDRVLFGSLGAVFGFGFLCVALMQIRRSTTRRLEEARVRDCRLELVETEKEELFGLARKVQRGMMPDNLPEIQGLAVDIRTSLRPELEGDFYDFFPFGSQALGILLSECKGNESSIALSDLLLQRELLVQMPDNTTPAKMLESANERISKILQRNFLASAMFLTINPQLKMMQYAGAGHPAALHIPGDGGDLQQLESSPKMLGCGGHISIQDRNTSFQRGDRFLLFSDGILKAARQNGAGLVPFGHPRLLESVLTHRESTLSAMLDALMKDMMEWCGGEEKLTDDVTVIGIEIV